uniref:Uncharacterized protein n=1 Tax=Manihot esculenta TaxID=3983 RepID=A0A2C9UAE3_MANES
MGRGRAICDFFQQIDGKRVRDFVQQIDGKRLMVMVDEKEKENNGIRGFVIIRVRDFNFNCECE